MRKIQKDSGAQPAPSVIPSLEQRITGLVELPIGDLKELWLEAREASPPKGARRRLLMLGIAWKWQADTHGGLSRHLERRLAKLETGFRRSGAVDVEVGKHAGGPRLMPGARLIRVWKDKRHEVIVTETGFFWQSRNWVSLSAIARAIIGSRRNGPAFFGLRDGDAA